MDSVTPVSCIPFLRDQISRFRVSSGNGREALKKKINTLARWLSLSAVEKKLETLDPKQETLLLESYFPEGGVFVGSDGYVLKDDSEGVSAYFEEQEGPAVRLALPKTIDSALANVPKWNVVFLDWNAQRLAWDELLQLWSDWETQGLIVVSGPVLVSYEIWKKFALPYYVVFRGDFHGAPLNTISVNPDLSQEPNSFLAKAAAFRKERIAAAPESFTPAHIYDDSNLEDLPMIPFTLENVNDPEFLWPRGLEGIQIRKGKTAKTTEKSMSEEQEPSVMEFDSDGPQLDGLTGSLDESSRIVKKKERASAAKTAWYGLFLLFLLMSFLAGIGYAGWWALTHFVTTLPFRLS